MEKSRRVQTHWIKEAPAWTRRQDADLARRQAVRINDINQGRRGVLEVGCAGGRLKDAFEVGVDISLSALKMVSKERVVVCCSATALPFRHGVFHASYTYGCIMHLEPGNQEKALKEMKRVSRGMVLHVEDVEVGDLSFGYSLKGYDAMVEFPEKGNPGQMLRGFLYLYPYFKWT